MNHDNNNNNTKSAIRTKTHISLPLFLHSTYLYLCMRMFASLCVAHRRPHHSCHYSSSFCWVWSIAPTLTSVHCIVFFIYKYTHTLIHKHTLSIILSLCRAQIFHILSFHLTFSAFYSLFFFFLFMLASSSLMCAVYYSNIIWTLSVFFFSFLQKKKFDSSLSIYFGLVRCFVIEYFYRSLFIAVNDMAEFNTRRRVHCAFASFTSSVPPSLSRPVSSIL